MFSWFLNWLADVGPVGGGDTHTSPRTQPSSPVEETLGRGMNECGGNSQAGVAGNDGWWESTGGEAQVSHPSNLDPAQDGPHGHRVGASIRADLPARSWGVITPSGVATS